MKKEQLATEPRDWDFTPTQSNNKERAANTAALATQMGLLSLIFNPISAGISAVYAGIRFGLSTRKLFNREKSIPYALDVLALEPLPEEHSDVHSLVDEFSKAAGITPPIAYKVTDEHLKRTAGPRYEEIVDTKATAAVFGPHIFYIHEDTIKAHKDSLRYIVSHEISHIAAGDTDFSGFLPHALVLESSYFAGLVVLASAGWQFVNAAFQANLQGMMDTMILGGITYAAVKATQVLSTLGLASASRTREYRADRNATYLSDDVEGALRFFRDHKGLSKKEDNSDKESNSPVDPAASQEPVYDNRRTPWSSHPTSKERKENILIAVQEVQKYHAQYNQQGLRV